MRAVTLTDGTTLDADLVVESVGSVPNTEWLDGNGLDLTNGVACDGRLRVLAGGVTATPALAARDDVVAAATWRGTRTRCCSARPAGSSTGRSPPTPPSTPPRGLARRPLGRAFPAGPDGGVFAAVPTFWSDQYDMRVQSFGVTGLPEVRILEGSLDGDVAVGYHHEGLLAGVVLIGLAAGTCIPRRGRRHHRRTHRDAERG